MKSLADQSINCCVTSPPYYGLRDYQNSRQIGIEATPQEYIANLVAIFKEVKRILRDDGTLWINIGDSYARKSSDGVALKNIIGIPWMLAFALQADGWFLRQDIIWHKPNAMPESVKDRCTNAHEYVFLLSKSASYYYDTDAVKEDAIGGNIGNGEKRNRRSVWSVSTEAFKGSHFAVFPPKLIEPCILAGCPEGGTVIDPFGGSGTVAGVALKHSRKSIICELNSDYLLLLPDRVKKISGIDVFELINNKENEKPSTYPLF